MVAAVTTKTSQGGVMIAAAGDPDTQVTQAGVMAVAIWPADFTKSSQAGVMSVTETEPMVNVSAAGVMIVARGRVNDPRVRAWTFTLDGHDFYVLRLGTTKTLIYDTATEQWYNWGSDTDVTWRAYQGCNWLAADTFASFYGSNTVVGDDGNGSLYFLNPDADTDDDAIFGADTPRTFERIVQGFVTTKGYNSVPCYGVELQGSIGDLNDDSDMTIKLEVSDDRGNTYTDCGTVSVADGSLSDRVAWRSLGSFSSPGRIFKVTDYGALRRIDALDMEDKD